ncbi:MAG TPA: response regulator [Rhodothermales bacterium]|nr:response regulator [Rhodothermales bacterium]
MSLTDPKDLPYFLLVEDNPSDAALTRRAFVQQGVANELRIARDGAEALKMLFGSKEEPYPELPLVVLLDLKLPRVSGLEVLRQIRAHERTRLLPVVIMTSSNEQRDVVEGYGLGANSYVRKPVNQAEFGDAVRQLGLYWLLLNQPPPHGSVVRTVEAVLTAS